MLYDENFCNCVHFNRADTKKIIWLILKYPKAHAILLYLNDQMDKNNIVKCTHLTLQNVLNISEATVRKNMQALEVNGFIKALDRNVYEVKTQLRKGA